MDFEVKAGDGVVESIPEGGQVLHKIQGMTVKGMFVLAFVSQQSGGCVPDPIGGHLAMAGEMQAVGNDYLEVDNDFFSLEEEGVVLKESGFKLIVNLLAAFCGQHQAVDMQVEHHKDSVLDVLKGMEGKKEGLVGKETKLFNSSKNSGLDDINVVDHPIVNGVIPPSELEGISDKASRVDLHNMTMVGLVPFFGIAYYREFVVEDVDSGVGTFREAVNFVAQPAWNWRPLDYSRLFNESSPTGGLMQTCSGDTGLSFTAAVHVVGYKPTMVGGGQGGVSHCGRLQTCLHPLFA